MFFVSLLLVTISSYSICCSFGVKNDENKIVGPSGLLYWLIGIFAQVVVTFEFLSLFKAINETNVLVLNFLFLILSLCVWFKTGRALYVPRFKTVFGKIWKALKKDKILMIMAFGFVFVMAYTAIIDAFLPVVGGDALAYHLNRASYWLHQGSLGHFAITDVRNLVMPINSEILYLWNIMFFKNDYGLYFVAYIGYLTSLFCVYNILEYFGFSERKKMWTVLVVGSLASVLGQASSLETDVLIGALILASILLFLNSLKFKSKSMIYFSSLAYALAIGTKSPAVIAFGGVFLLLCWFSYQKLQKEFYKPILTFLGFLVFNFVIFSSYNYILNFIAYSNPLGSEGAVYMHGFRGGIKAFVANYIKYIFMMFDFSGFRYSDYVGTYITQARSALLTFLHIPLELGVEMPDNNLVNNRLLNVKMGVGMLGFLLFLPSIVTAIVLAPLKKAGKKIKAMSVFAWMFLINTAFLSASIAYMVFSVRFVTFLVLISSPVFAVTYMKKTNIVKLLILFVVMSYFVIIGTNFSGRQAGDLARVVLEERTLHAARERIRGSLYIGFKGPREFLYIKSFIQSTPKNTRFAIFPSITEIYPIDMLNSHGWKVETLLAEKAPFYNYKNYDYIILTDKVIISTVLLKNTKDIKVKYKVDKKGNAYYPKYNAFTCVYETREKSFYTNESKNTKIVDSRCFIDKPFFEARGFEAIKGIDLVSPDPTDSHYITIYKNMHK